MGAPVCYWLDLRAINPPQEAKALSQPMLILQGGKDYQVTEKDFALAQKINDLGDEALRLTKSELQRRFAS